MNSAVGVFGFAKMGQDLVTHRTRLERATRLDILQLQKDAAAGRPGEGGGLDERSLNPWCFEGWLVVVDGRHDAPHFVEVGEE